MIGIYGGNVLSIEDYRRNMMKWNTVKDWNESNDPDATESDFSNMFRSAANCPETLSQENLRHPLFICGNVHDSAMFGQQRSQYLFHTLL